MIRVLFDTCIWGGAKKVLLEAGYDVIWAGDWPEDPGDQEILKKAHAEERILITLDKDFGELAIVRNLPHSGIVRLVGLSALDQAHLAIEVLVQHSSILLQGAIITVEKDRIRVRPPSST